MLHPDDARTFRVDLGPHTVGPVTLHQRGLAAMINATAAVTTARLVLGDGFSPVATMEALRTVRPPFGRGEVIDAGGSPLELVLVKNPAGFTVALGTYLSEPVTTMVAINDDYADGQDVSWLYDVSFESLRENGVALTSGVRAYDMALRLDYDDVAVACGGARPRPRAGPAARGTPRRAAPDLLHLHRDDEAETAAGGALRAGRLRRGERMTSKGLINLVHLYPREMSIYGDLGNTRCLASRIRRHGYEVRVHDHHPGSTLPDEPHLFMGGGGQDSGQSRVEEDLAVIADRLHGLAGDGVPMIMICGMYQLFGNAFITVEGQELPGLGILDVTTRGNPTRMIGGIVLDTGFGEVVGFENHSGATVLGSGQAPFGTVRAGHGNNGTDRTEGAVTGHVIGSYLHGPILPANPRVADHLIARAAELATGRPFEPADVDDALADQARSRQVRRLVAA